MACPSRPPAMASAYPHFSHGALGVVIRWWITAGQREFGQTGAMNGRPRTTYADAADGSLIAYQTLGDGPLDLIYLTGSISHVDMRWEDPASARFCERLASFSGMNGVLGISALRCGLVSTQVKWRLAEVISAGFR